MELKMTEQELMRKIQVLEWDKRIRQINFAKEHELQRHKKELENIKAEQGTENAKI